MVRVNIPTGYIGEEIPPELILSYKSGSANQKFYIPSTLFNDILTKEGSYGAFNLGNSIPYAEFVVPNGYRNVEVWLTCGNYSDSLGSSGKSTSLRKLDEKTGNFVVLNNNVPTTKTSTWFRYYKDLEPGRYRMYPNGAYVQLNELFMSGIKNTNNFICQEGEYKKFFDKSSTDGKSNLIPVMTSNTVPSGIASASSVYSSDFAAWKAFNGSTINNNDAWVSLDNQAENWLQYEFPEKIIIGKYSITGYNLEGHELYNPQSWNLEGYSEVTKTWDVLDSQNNQSFTLNETKEYEINTLKSYKKYRLYITSMNNMSRVAVSELKIFEMQTKAMWYTISNDIPDSIKFLEEGMNLSLLDRRVETLEPQKMLNKSDILFTNGEEGKVFSKTIDLGKYIDIRKIEVR